MNSTFLFEMALGLDKPWLIKDVKFDNDKDTKELHITIGFDKKHQFIDQENIDCKVYDTKERVWQHLNFFEHKCYLHCKVPRLKDSQGKVTMIDVPWSRKGSGFTLLFEAFAMRLIESEMPMNQVAKLLRVHANSIWTIFNYWIKKSYSEDNIDEITQLGIDETSSKKGHKYITVGVDLETKRVIHATAGKNAKTIETIKDYLVSKSVEPAQIQHASIDLSPSFISGLKNNFPDAEIHFDRFHVKKLLNEAMDEVRKIERKEHAELKGHKYTFLKNKDKLSDKKNQELSELITLFPTLGAAYRLKELFDDVWQMRTEEEASDFIDYWVKEVKKSNVPAFIKFSNTVIKHKYGIINFVKNKINNGILESINSKIQLAKKRARGYRNTDNFINMVYFLCGKLNFSFPHDYA
tara:strand:- start:16 stop:1242 length:1227 start_codon:yes stop_codon:yes gene_type:complete